MGSHGYDRILVPTDMSDFATLAVRFGVMFRERLGSELTLLFADELYFPLDLLDLPMGYYLENAPETRKKLEEKLAEYAAAQVPGGAATMVVQDAPSRAITNVARDLDADLVIMGTHGRRGWRRALLGSVAEAVLHETSVPVLTITPSLMEQGKAPEIRRIVCPVNFTRVARESLQHASALAEALEAELVVIYVAEGIEADRTPHVETAFSQWVDPQIRDRCTYRALVCQGNPAERVLEVAQELAADLLVIGAQHRRFNEATVIGTTTERITRFARCPVLTVMLPATVEEPISAALAVGSR